MEELLLKQPANAPVSGSAEMGMSNECAEDAGLMSNNATPWSASSGLAHAYNRRSVLGGLSVKQLQGGRGAK